MHGKYAFVRIETVTERRRLHRLFLRFSFADCMHLAGGCRNEVEITAKTRWLCPFANCTKKQLFRRGNASIFLLLSGFLFCTVFFCIGRVFSVCRKRDQTPAQPTNEYLFFLFSAKAVLLAFLYFCFGQNFTS